MSQADHPLLVPVRYICSQAVIAKRVRLDAHHGGLGGIVLLHIRFDPVRHRRVPFAVPARQSPHNPVMAFELSVGWLAPVLREWLILGVEANMRRAA